MLPMEHQSTWSATNMRGERPMMMQPYHVSALHAVRRVAAIQRNRARARARASGLICPLPTLAPAPAFTFENEVYAGAARPVPAAPKLTAVPTIDELLRDPARAHALPASALIALLASTAAVQAVLSAELLARGQAQPAPAKDRWLKPDEASAVLRRDRRWLYRHARTLPFVKKISARSFLCSETGIHRWLATRQGA